MAARSLPPAIVASLWHPSGIRYAVERSVAILSVSRPEAVELRGSIEDIAANAPAMLDFLRSVLPDARYWLGPLTDPIWGAVRVGRMRYGDGIVALARIGKLAGDIGAEAVLWHAGADWTTEPERAGIFAEELVRLVASDVPRVVQAHTTSQQPSAGSYPWRSWLGLGTPISMTLLSATATGPGVIVNQASVDADWRLLASRRQVAPYLLTGWSLPAMGARADDLCSAAEAGNWVAFGPIPASIDSIGSRALAAVAELARRGFRGPGAIRAFQRANGLVPSGRADSTVLAVLG